MSETTQEPWTIKRLLEWTVSFFGKTDAASARLDAEVLLAEALACPRIALYTQYDSVPDDQALEKFRSWVKRRAAGEPVAYLVGQKEFYSLPFEVTPDVLIPRPETEHVVMCALELAQQIPDRPLRIIDVGTGSGCIAIALAKQLKDSLGIDDLSVAATDISPAAIEVAKRNAQRHGLDQQIRFFVGDLLTALPSGSRPVHLIVSNPPYVGRGEINTLDENVRLHEPDVALFGGPLGTEIIERLIDQSLPMQLPGGALIFETSPINIDRCVQIASARDAFESVTTEKDLGGLPRVVIARLKPS